MLKRSHIALGTMAALMVQRAPTIETVCLVVGSAFGSTLPDFDIKLNIPHRTITHWLLWPALLFYFFHGFPLLTGIALGWASHILADCFTVGGLRPLWPARWQLRGIIKTGTMSEFLFVFSVLGLIGYILYRDGILSIWPG
jgi:membrane-bound metal-dependent hydrolase YbcI (DUF457 family)